MNAFTERHGGMLDDCVRVQVKHYNLKGKRQMKMGLAAAYQAKSGTIKRNCRTPEQAVFGKSLRWMTSLLNDDDDDHLAAKSAESEAVRATMMRATACRRLHKKDLKAKYRRALRRPRKGWSCACTFPARVCTSGTRRSAREDPVGTPERGGGLRRFFRRTACSIFSVGVAEFCW